MHFLHAAVLALPLLATAAQQQSASDQVKELAVHWFNRISSFIPYQNTQRQVTSKTVAARVDILTLDNWKSTLRSTAQSSSEAPEEWFVLISGGNKTCHDRCGTIETAFNESLVVFGAIPLAPHLAYINCDHQSVLCNSWAVQPPNLWVLEVGTPGSPVDIYPVHLNTTTTTPKTFIDFASSKSYRTGPRYEGYFHPFDSLIAKSGLSTPLGYIILFFSFIPSWVVMIIVVSFSRTVMYVIWN
jgi:hypothetical protein